MDAPSCPHAAAAATQTAATECPYKSNGTADAPTNSQPPLSPLMQHALDVASMRPLSYVDASGQAVDMDAARRNGMAAVDAACSPTTTLHPADSSVLTPADEQEAAALPQMRQVSSIPRSITDTPAAASTPDTQQTQPQQGQPQQEQYWMYPSQQQFYRAMKRKNYEPRAEDMQVVVPMHNVVNEMAWRKILQWEQRHCTECATPKLKSFTGRPTDRSPKAHFWSTVLGATPPFDRHDWVVDRCGRDVRYVLDFYTGKQPKGDDTNSSALVALHLDVRPALDSPQAALDRIVCAAEELQRGVSQWWSSLSWWGRGG